MSRSPYAVTSALRVVCPECEAAQGNPCIKVEFPEPTVRLNKLRSCSTRRRAADNARTREVNPEVMKP
jgi:hypothetical protein